MPKTTTAWINKYHDMTHLPKFGAIDLTAVYIYIATQKRSFWRHYLQSDSCLDQLICWSSKSPLSTNMAMSDTKGQGWIDIPTK